MIIINEVKIVKDDKGEKMANYELIATAAMGIEAVVAKEVRS